jgi:hypothetical protein
VNIMCLIVASITVLTRQACPWPVHENKMSMDVANHRGVCWKSKSDLSGTCDNYEFGHTNSSS